MSHPSASGGLRLVVRVSLCGWQTGVPCLLSCERISVSLYRVAVGVGVAAKDGPGGVLSKRMIPPLLGRCFVCSDPRSAAFLCLLLRAFSRTSSVSFHVGWGVGEGVATRFYRY